MADLDCLIAIRIVIDYSAYMRAKASSNRFRMEVRRTRGSAAVNPVNGRAVPNPITATKRLK